MPRQWIGGREHDGGRVRRDKAVCGDQLSSADGVSLSCFVIWRAAMRVILQRALGLVVFGSPIRVLFCSIWLLMNIVPPSIRIEYAHQLSCVKECLGPCRQQSSPPLMFLLDPGS